MITIERLHKVLSGRHVLDGVDLSVANGEVVALVGPSGTGKSVLIQHVAGLLLPDSGDVRIDGQSIVQAGRRDLNRIRRRTGFVFQDPALLDSLTVRENLRLALDDRECRRNPMHASDRIAHATDIMLYDEPTTGLDPRNVSAINELILRSRDALGATAIVATHDMASLPVIADRVAFLYDGSIRFDGSPSDFAASPDPLVGAFLLGNAGNVDPLRPPVWNRG
jgi:phospholipid/cholesterol/gamma-HCH transport system ATP-binding protein